MLRPLTCLMNNELLIHFSREKIRDGNYQLEEDIRIFDYIMDL